MNDLFRLANTLSNDDVAEIIEALEGMVANACTIDGRLEAMRSAANEEAINVLVKLGRAEWVDENRGIAKWRKP